MFRKTWLALCLAGVAALFLMSSKANADVVPEAIGFHIGSKHFPQAEWNNSNPGVYLRGTINNAGWASGSYVVGTYYNSERHQSAYIGRVVPILGNFDLVVGVISGYERAAILPMVVPSVRFPLVDRWDARVSFLPRVEKSGANVVHLSFERRF